MDSTFSYSSDRYGTFSSAEHAEYDMIRDGLHWPEPDITNPLDFESFISSLRADQFGRVPQNISFGTSMQAVGQHGDDSLLLSTPSSSNSDLDTPTLTPSECKLSLPAESPSFSPYIEPLSAFDLSSLSSSILSLPKSPKEGDTHPKDDGANALGLLGAPHLSSEGIIFSASTFLPGVAGQLKYVTELRPDILDSSGNYAPSPTVDTDTLLANRNDLQKPSERHIELQLTISSEPQVGIVAGNAATSSDTVINPQALRQSPSIVPERTSVQPPHYTICEGRVKSSRLLRATTMQTEANPARRAARLVQTSQASSADPSYSTRPTSTPSADECEYGWRVWVVEGGGRIAKWKCRFCEQLVGRRPDLHRHYKTCVVKAKFRCVDVIHADGSVWSGCGQKFSRRDACHRHLKKRFTDGRCMRKAPKTKRCESEDDYIKKMICFEDTNRNYKWRAALPASEKNTLAKSALSHIKQDMF